MAMGPLGATTNQIEHSAMQAVNRLSMSMNWFDTHIATNALLGDRSFTAGVAAGMLKNLATGIYELAWMLKMFALAEYYDQRSGARLRNPAFMPSDTLMITMSVASVFWPPLNAAAREAAEQREALIATVVYAFQHPGEIFNSIGSEQQKKFEEFKAYHARHTLSGEFLAGMLFGELLLDVLMILDGVTAIAKIAAKIPGLLKMLPRLQKMAPALRGAAKVGDAAKLGGDAAGEAGAAARTGAEARMGATKGAKSEGGSKGPEAKKAPEAGEKPEGKAKKDCVCALAGKPVDAIAGCKVLFDQTDLDFDLPAPLALAWQRTYSSDNPRAGLLGQGWSLPISLALEFSSSSITLLDGMHRGITFPLLRPGESFHSQYEQLTLTRIDLSDFELLDDDAVRSQFRLLDLGVGIARLVGQVDRNGNRFSIDYDARQVPVRVNDSAGRILVLAVDHNDRLTGVSELRAADPASTGEQQPQVAVALVSYEYGAAGDLVRVRNQAGQATREFAYRNHMMVSHAQPGGLVSEYEYSAYTPSGRVLRNTTNTGQSWQFVYAIGQTMVTDNLGRREYYKFDRQRRYTGKTDALGGAERFDLDAFGNLVARTGADGSIERYQYDGRSRLTRIEAADGAVTTIGYDIGCDKPAIITDALGASTRLRRDGAGNLASITDALGQRTEYRYDKRGLPVELIDARGGRKRMAYNLAGQLTAYTDCSGQTTHFDYDRDGHLTHTTDALGNRSTYAYDRAGRLVSASYPDGTGESYDYDALGRLVGHTDAAGHRTAYALDAEGRLLARTNALGGRLEYHYDGAKRLAQLVNENGAVYAFGYDALDRLAQQTGFDTCTTRYAYDKAGRALAKTELGQTGAADGPGLGAAIETLFRRDAAGRLVEKTVTGGTPQQRSAGPLVTRYRYDALGRLTEAANDDATVTLAYDAIGQLREERSHAQGANTGLRHAYDALGNRIQTILPDGRTLNHLFYGSGHLHQINLDGEVVSDIERDARHRAISRSQGALTTRLSYDPVGRLLSQVAGDGAAAPVIARNYEYDRNGNLILIDDSRNGHTNYSYDAIGRILAAVQPSLNERFAFDPAHNLLDPSVGSGGRVESNRVRVFEDKRFNYDSHGNLSEKLVGRHTRMQFEWDAAHQMVKSTVTRKSHQDQPAVQTVKYSYDPFGRRIAKRDAFGTTRFAWDGNRLLCETRASHCRTYVYESGSFVPLAQIDSKQQAESANNQPRARVHYLHTDHLGTPREMTDPEGRLTWIASYKAWGNVLRIEQREPMALVQPTTRAMNDPSQEALAQAQPIRFQGQYHDVETGLHYNRFRYYDPDVGRFVSQDPIGLMGGTNLMQYAPNPTTWIDPLGLSFLEMVDGSIVRTGSKFQGAEIFKFTEKTKIGDVTFRKGDYFYVDNLHKDHFETFSANNESKGVFNLDGTLNESKTKRAERRKGPLCKC